MMMQALIHLCSNEAGNIGPDRVNDSRIVGRRPTSVVAPNIEDLNDPLLGSGDGIVNHAIRGFYRRAKSLNKQGRVVLRLSRVRLPKDLVLVPRGHFVEIPKYELNRRVFSLLEVPGGGQC